MSQPPIAPVQRTQGNVLPDRLYVLVDKLPVERAEVLAMQAVREAQAHAPKLSGESAKRIRPYFGTGFFGITWEDNYLWYQNIGTKPFTMRSLAGKTIPMWIDDPTGQMASENPKAKTRITASGRKQVLVFRRVGKIGARKTKVIRKPDGSMAVRSVPQSYPGAPGRITYRTTVEYPPGQSTGRIAGAAHLVTRSNIGVRWRNPGLAGRHFMERAIQATSEAHGLGNPALYVTYRRR